MGMGRAIIIRTKCDFLLAIGGSTFSGQVSDIEPRDAAIFARIKPLLLKGRKSTLVYETTNHSNLHECVWSGQE